MDDHRVFERFPVRFPARLLNQGSGNEDPAETFDVSAKGVGVQSKQALKPRSALEMWFDLPDKAGPLYARGQVVWTTPAGSNNYRSGIELERADLMGISRFLRV